MIRCNKKKNMKNVKNFNIEITLFHCSCIYFHNIKLMKYFTCKNPLKKFHELWYEVSVNDYFVHNL